MRVSVIVPARNAEKTLGDCLTALRAQDFPREDYEVIVVDDGSTDGTADAAAAGGARVLRIPPSGPAAARNRGAAEARGEILAFTDADCAPDRGWLAALTAPLADPGVIGSKGVYRSEQASLTARFVQLEYESRYRRTARFPSVDFIDTYSAAFRRSLYLDCGGCDESFRTASTEDQELGFRYVKKGGTVKFVPEAVVRHLHADSPRKYFRKKLRIGFGKARVLARHPRKAASDSHTPFPVKLEMLSALLCLFSAGLIPTRLGPLPLLVSAAVFAASAFRFAASAFRRDARLGLASLGLLPLRALGLGLGLAGGALALVLSNAAAGAAWGALVLGAFLAASAPLIAPTFGFFATAFLLVLIAYSALLSGFRILGAIQGRLPAKGEPWDPLERTALELGLGMGAVMAGAFGLGLLHLYRPQAAWCLLALSLLGPHRPFLRSLRARLTGGRGAGGERRSRPASARALGAVLLLVAVMTFLVSIAPATAQDALAYHLAVPAKYIERGGIVYIPESFFAQFPANVEMLFTLALLLQGESLAGGCHWLLGLGATLAVAALARRLRGAIPQEEGLPPVGLTAAAIFATVPTVALIAGWAYVDLGLVLFEVLSTLFFLRWWEDGDSPRRGRWLVLSGVLAGLAAGCKYTGGAQGVLIVLGVLVEGAVRKRRLSVRATALLVAATAVALPAAPWWLKNVVYTGNPLFPFLYGIFGGEGWDATRAATLSAFLGGWGEGRGGILETVLLPWRLTMSARFFSIERFDGMIGPGFLIGAPLVAAALWKGRPGQEGCRGALWVLAGFSLGHALLWLATTSQVRFLLPALSLWAVMIEAALPAALAAGRWRAIAGGALRLGIALNAVIIAIHFAAHNPLPVVMGIETEARYLEREVPGGDYPVFHYIDRELPPESFILFGASGNPGFLCKRRYHADPLLENRTLAQVLRRGKDPAGVEEELRRRGFTHLLFRWELVFDPSGRRSEIPLEDQRLLAEFLNRSGRLQIRSGGTFLYRLETPR